MGMKFDHGMGGSRGRSPNHREPRESTRNTQGSTAARTPHRGDVEIFVFPKRKSNDGSGGVPPTSTGRPLNILTPANVSETSKRLRNTIERWVKSNGLARGLRSIKPSEFGENPAVIILGSPQLLCKMRRAKELKGFEIFANETLADYLERTRGEERASV